MEREVVLEETDSIAVTVTDVAVDDRGFFYVLDGMNHRVVVFEPQGHRRGTFGTLGEGPAELKSPGGVLVSRAGEVLVGDTGNSRISVWDTSGVFLRTAPCRRGVGRIRWLGATQELIATRSSGGQTSHLLMVVYDLSGTVVRSLGESPAEVFELRRKIGAPISGSAYGVAPEGEVPLCHAGVYHIARYSAEGALSGHLAAPPGSGFVAPSAPPPAFSSQSPQEWAGWWTAIGRLVALTDVVVVQMWAEAKRGVTASRSYLVDVLRRDGKPLWTSIPTDETIVDRLGPSSLLTAFYTGEDKPFSQQVRLRIRSWRRTP
ncbi:MAG: hypothetical protein ONB30_12350 [candidate division KSB1 bacterium]|nr:hypothetical protein [candidate division KSB1 bacterium]